MVALATIIGTFLLSLFFIKEYLTQANGGEYNLPLSIVFLAQTCIAILGLVKGKRSWVFITLGTFLFLIVIYVTVL